QIDRVRALSAAKDQHVQLVTGNPIRTDFAHLKKKERGDKLNVLIFGGSQGAHAINLAMIEALPLLADKNDQISITHQTGERDFEMVQQAYANAGFEG